MNTTETKLFLVMAGLLAVSVAVNIIQVVHSPEIVNPEYLRGNTLEIPEELTEANEDSNLGVYIQDGKIELYFKPYTEYQIQLFNDSIFLFDGTKQLHVYSFDDLKPLSEIIKEDNR